MDDSYILRTIFNYDPSKPGSTEFYQIVIDQNLTKKFEDVNDYVIVDKNEKDDGDETSSYEVISS